MVLDTSVLIALLRAEDCAPRLLKAIEDDPVRRVSVVSVIECALVMLSRAGDAGDAEVDRLLRGLNAEICDVTEEQMTLAREAVLVFRKGRHPAALNLGDFFPYALARASGDLLLFTGDDFSRTDVRVADW
jgi:ribonuclease VapC